MTHFVLRSVLLAGLALSPSLAFAADDQDESVEFHGPEVHPGYPDALHVGGVLKKSNVSPNGKYGLIFGDNFNSEFIGMDNYIVGLQPDRILGRLATSIPYCSGTNGGFYVYWAPDSSTVLVDNHGKWAPRDITVIEFKGGRVVRQTDVLPGINQAFRSAIAKAEHTAPKEAGGPALYKVKVEWIRHPRLQVRILCEGETNPKGFPGHSKWTGTLEAVWDVEQVRFVSRKITHQTYVLKVEETE